MKIDVIELENGQKILVEVLDIKLSDDVKNKINISNDLSVSDFTRSTTPVVECLLE